MDKNSFVFVQNIMTLLIIIIGKKLPSVLKINNSNNIFLQKKMNFSCSGQW